MRQSCADSMLTDPLYVRRHRGRPWPAGPRRTVRVLLLLTEWEHRDFRRACGKERRQAWLRAVVLEAVRRKLEEEQ